MRLFCVISAFLLVACSGFTQKNLGDLGEGCFGDGTCNGDLVCVNKVCVEATVDDDTVVTDEEKDDKEISDTKDEEADSSDTGDDAANPDDDTDTIDAEVSDVVVDEDTVIPDDDELIPDADTDTIDAEVSDVVVDEDTVIVDEDTVIPDDDELIPDADTDTSPYDCGPSPSGKGGPMCKVPAGDFWMGCNTAVDNECNSDGREAPYHKVTLDAYLMDQYAVTNEEYQVCVDAMVCTAKHYDDGTCYIYNGTSWVLGTVPAQFRGNTNPVVCVTWDEARTYCEWAGKRLPTEAEWEKAARGTEGWKYPWGNLPFVTCEYAVMNDPNAGGYGCGTNGTLPVGSRPKGVSPYGIYGMMGNVWEWVNDWYAVDYYTTTPSINPPGPATGDSRVLRGGAWDDHAALLRASHRFSATPGATYSTLGFRCAK